MDTLSLMAGTQTLPLPDGDAGAQVVFGAPATFFVVVTLTSGANSQTPHRFRVTHVTESSSTAEDRATDTPLLLEYAPNVSSRSVLAASPSSDEDLDGLFDIVETNTGVYVSPADTGTDPFDPDTDDDGLLDSVEDDTGVYVSPTQTGTDPNDPDDTSPLPLPALGPCGQALLLLALAGSAAGGLRLRRRRA